MLSPEAEKEREKLIKNRGINFNYSVTTPLETQRKEWENSALQAILPQEIQIDRVTDNHLSAEWITKQGGDKKRVILYFHGGGNCLGSSITHRKLVSHIVYDTHLAALVHNFPLSPEHPFPAALNYSKDVYIWLLNQGVEPGDVIFGGDSSGGGLALATMLLIKGERLPLPKATFLLSPMLDFTLSGCTLKTHAKLDSSICEEDLILTVGYYCSNTSPFDPLISPIYGDLVGLPPLFIQTGSDEILLSDSIRLAEKAKSAGVDVQLEVWNKMWHVFQSRAQEVPESKKAIEKIGHFINHVFSK